MVKKINFAMGMTLIAFMLVGCASTTTIILPTIPGVDTSGVWLFVNEDGTSATISGQVSRRIDSLQIEEFVRNEYGYEEITNQITTD